MDKFCGHGSNLRGDNYDPEEEGWRAAKRRVDQYPQGAMGPRILIRSAVKFLVWAESKLNEEKEELRCSKSFLAINVLTP